MIPYKLPVKQTRRTFLDVSEDLLEDVKEGCARREDATTSRVRIERPERPPGVHVVAENRRPSVAPVPACCSSSPRAIAVRPVRLRSLCRKEQHRHCRDMNARAHHDVAVAVAAGSGVVVGVGVRYAGAVVLWCVGGRIGSRVDIRRVILEIKRTRHG